MSIEVNASVAKSAETREWSRSLEADGETKERAIRRSETFVAQQRFYHEKHGEGTDTHDGVTAAPSTSVSVMDEKSTT